jgi:membrane protease YdiL (CAAX protease family)
MRPTSSHEVPWRDVAIYTLLTYAIAWAIWLPSIPNVFDLLSAERTPAKFHAPSIIVAGMFAPAIAATLMRLFISREGLKGSLGPVRNWRAYGVALVVPAVLITLVIVFDVVVGLSDFTWHEDLALPLAYGVLALRAMTFGAALTFGEEYGWRGYLLPKLLRLGEVKAAIIVGLIWGPWHAPLLIDGLNYSSVNPVAAIAVLTVTTVALSLLLTRLFVAAGGAVLVAALMHTSFNSFSDTLTTTDHLTGNPLVVNPAGAVGIGLVLITVLLTHTAPRRIRKPRSRRVASALATPDPSAG